MRGGGGSGGMRGGGGFRGGSGFHGGNVGGFHNGGFHNNFNRFGFRGFYNYGYYPAFYGSWWDPFWYNDSYPSSYDYPYAGYASYPYGGYASGTPPVVIVNSTPYGYPAAPAVEYEPAPPVIVQPPQPPAASALPQSGKYDEQLYLVAFRDGVIRPAVAYWVEGTTLHYVTMDHEQKQTPLTSVDRGLSERLNRERNVPFRLPG